MCIYRESIPTHDFLEGAHIRGVFDANRHAVPHVLSLLTLPKLILSADGTHPPPLEGGGIPAHDFIEGAHVGGVFDANRHAVGLFARVSGFRMMGFGYISISIHIHIHAHTHTYIYIYIYIYVYIYI